MKRLVLTGLFLALSAGAAHAEKESVLAARLVRDGCIPIVKNAALANANVPTGGSVMTTAQKTAIGINPSSSAWSYPGEDDEVILELGREGCNVFTAATGDESFLKPLEQAVG